MSGMGQIEFLQALFETGQVKVGPLDGSPGDGLKNAGAAADRAAAVSPGALDVIRGWDAANRLEFPGRAPPLAETTAVRSAEVFYRACQFAVYRDVDAQTVATLFTEPVHESIDGGANGKPATAADHYTVDLVFRFLPELYRLAHRAASADPLCDGLRLWAAEWPLSSIGMAAIGAASTNPMTKGEANPDDLATVCNDEGLLRLYADRVIARRDTSRLADPRVRAAVRTALGHFDDLCPPIAKALAWFETPPPAAPSSTSGPTSGADSV
jgi:hypothetical protein